MGKVVSAWHWALLLVRGRRCWSCHRRYLWHLPWQMHRCNRAPISAVLYDQEREQVA
jgi:hypothetical protein